MYKVQYDLHGDNFKDALFLMDEVVGLLAQVKNDPVAYYFERLISTMVMSQEGCSCEDDDSPVLENIDKSCASVMYLIEALK